MNTKAYLFAAATWLATGASGLSQPNIIQFTSANHVVCETGGVATITVEIIWRGDPFAVYTVDYATSNGTATAGLDYLAQNGTLSFEYPETNKTFTIPILSDNLPEPIETVVLALSNPAWDGLLGSRSNALLVLYDSAGCLHQPISTVQFTAASYPVSETGGVAIVTIERIGEPAGTAYVEYFTLDGTSTEGDDYTGQSGFLQFFGETNLTISIPIINDALAEDDETVLIILSWWDPINTVLGQRSRACLVIRDDDSLPVPTPIPPLTRWHERRPFPTTETLRNVVYGNGRFVAVGDGGAIVTSEDGFCWFLANSGTSARLTKVAYGNGLFVAVGVVDPDGFGAGGVLLSSFDGMHWTRTSCAESNCYLRAVTYGNDLFVAVGWQGAILTSANGLDWRRENSGGNTYLEDVAFGNRTFLAVGYGLIATSPDGRTWQLDVDNPRFWGNSATVVYGNGRFGFVTTYRSCVGEGCCPGGFDLFTSETGLSWTHEVGSRGVHCSIDWLQSLSYGDGLFVAMRRGSFGTIGLIVSSDLTPANTRTFPAPPDGIASLCVGNYTIVGVGADGLIVQSDPLLRLAPSITHRSTLDISGPIGSSVRVEAAENPAQTNAWQVGGTLSLTNHPQAWTDPQATNSAKRFYRAVLLP